ncbi:NAD(P)/FAD-dependent oxidoreductase [Pantoea phytobeneficialis]|uniref:FAD-binding oxidoreductase n=1 Tax=Pantoea phytobeneficialis TaxID=2052056 RepID=A0AAP9HAY1_9GAMM|nr:FAD-binding oxidoreductase [Pantoea phytobeneficialis]MDO6406937.1 FAD-binding oxidoreductase [Pantoea phytobeneficialis]QGR09903.1 FAD-dependent oxidoreductase [Pantoea phytobeneficialis]
MTSTRFDVCIVGGGVMGCSTALFLAKAGMRVVVVERNALCRSASGVNAGTLTLHMTRAALVPYAMKAWEMWMRPETWLGQGVLATHAPGLSLAFTDAEVMMLEERAAARREYGADISVISPQAAMKVDPGINGSIKAAAFCEIDGFASAYLTGRAFYAALREAGVTIIEQFSVGHIERQNAGYRVSTEDRSQSIVASRLVLAGGVWLEPMLAMIGIHIPVKTLINQLIVTERMPTVMRSVLSIANGLLSMKQFANGTVVIGGGWQGIGSRELGGRETIPENLIGNLRLGQHAVPALASARVARIWLGLESETADAMPMIGPLAQHPDLFVIGCVHSGYTSGPYMGKLLAQQILGQQPEMPLFDPSRLLPTDDQAVASLSRGQ